MATTRHVVAKVGEIPLGGKKLVSVKGRDIGVFNVNGEFFALLNKCPHAGASLCHGRIIGLAQADEPGQYRLSARASCCAAPGTAGSSTSAPASPGAIRTASGSGASR